MAGMGHPPYSSPIIAEAVCEIHFRLPAEATWPPSLPGEFFKHIQDEYPVMETLQDIGLQFEVGPGGVRQQFAPPKLRIRFRHHSRPVLLQLAENTLTINFLPPYPGWESMRITVLEAWHRSLEVFEPAVMTWISLRYINRIERAAIHERPKDWLNTTDYIPAGVLCSDRGFVSRVETHLDPQNRLLVTVADQAPTEASRFGAIIFDIDRIVEREMLPEESILEQEMNRLHTDVWTIFAAARTERLIRLLEQKAE